MGPRSGVCLGEPWEQVGRAVGGTPQPLPWEGRCLVTHLVGGCTGSVVWKGTLKPQLL